MINEEQGGTGVAEEDEECDKNTEGDSAETHNRVLCRQKKEGEKKSECSPLYQHYDRRALGCLPAGPSYLTAVFNTSNS